MTSHARILFTILLPCEVNYSCTLLCRFLGGRFCLCLVLLLENCLDATDDVGRALDDLDDLLNGVGSVAVESIKYSVK